jgi:hypothetical protein
MFIRRRASGRSLLFGLCSGSALLVAPGDALPGTRASRAAPPAGRGLIDFCIDRSPGYSSRTCDTWMRQDDSLIDIYSREVLHIERLDAGGVLITGTGGQSAIAKRFSGTLTGNHLDGTMTMQVLSVTLSSTGSGWFFQPPPASARSEQTAFVLCPGQASMINTGDHTVTTVALDTTQQLRSVTVSPDGSKAYVSTTTSPPESARLFVLDAKTGTIAKTADLKASPTPTGFASLAIAGDGTTLYGVGFDRKHTGMTIVAMDAGSLAVLGAIPLPASYRWDTDQQDPRVVMLGTRVALDDGSLPDITPPKGGPAVFGSTVSGLAAFPDGSRLCSRGRIITVTGFPGSGTVQPYIGISPDGSQIFTMGIPIIDKLGTSATNRNYGVQTAVLLANPAAGETPDAKTGFAVERGIERVLTIDVAGGVITDAIPICAGAQLLGMPTLTR